MGEQEEGEAEWEYQERMLEAHETQSPTMSMRGGDIKASDIRNIEAALKRDHPELFQGTVGLELAAGLEKVYSEYAGYIKELQTMASGSTRAFRTVIMTTTQVGL